MNSYQEWKVKRLPFQTPRREVPGDLLVEHIIKGAVINFGLVRLSLTLVQSWLYGSKIAIFVRQQSLLYRGFQYLFIIETLTAFVAEF